MSDHKSSFFLRPFGQPDLLKALEAEWAALSKKILLPQGTPRPDHARLHFFQLAQELDAFQRRWSAQADTQANLQERLQAASQSLQGLLDQARWAYEAVERQRIEQQKLEDQRRWSQHQEQQLQARRQAEHQAKLAQTHREIQAIYDDIRHQQKVSHERRNASWQAANFPATTCSCGRSKMAHHLFCWDCSPGRRAW